jgi:hypothetical protein
MSLPARGPSILFGGGCLFGNLRSITGLMIGDLKPQKLVDGRQCFCGRSSYLPSSATGSICSDWRATWLDKWRTISEPISNGSRSRITIRSTHTSIWLYAV